jgi:asparagine synthase (glutamine-hydrolysing)
MCGIAGFNWKNEEQIRRMTQKIAHRGPDGDGHFCDEKVSLGHRRLAIIDLSDGGRQPMNFQHLWITYNGEIFNYLQIRQELSQLGHTFQSSSDTEVILHAYAEWGREAVKKFNGEWAFCIYDKNRNELFLSRDRWSIKPLYYWHEGQKFVFASEIKAILEIKPDKQINEKALNQYFYQKYTLAEQSIYTGIKSIPSSCSTIYKLDSDEFLIEEYYNLQHEVEKATKINLDERLFEIEKCLPAAIIKRLVADVPVGAFLSGGLDSSYISAIISYTVNKPKTFTIGFSESSFDEVPFAEKVAKHINTEHYTQYLAFNDDLIETVFSKMDEPFGDSSILPTFLLSKMTREQVTVSLSGDAGDEIFGGYDTYLAYKTAKFIPGFSIPALKSLVKLVPPSDKKVSLEFKMKRFLRKTSPHPLQQHLDWMATFLPKERQKLLNEQTSNLESKFQHKETISLQDIQLLDFKTYLQDDILRKVDMASMFNSLEARVPFLDFELVPFVLSLPDEYKIRFFKTKWLLKNLAKTYLPKEIINRKKRGFSVPVSKWLTESELMKEYLLSKNNFAQNIINFEYVNQLYKSHLAKEKDNSRELWLVFVFNYWYKNVFKR